MFALVAVTSVAQVKISSDATRVHVDIGGKPYTDFFYKGAEVTKPYLWPLSAASGFMVTRHFPMETVARGATDHPHQRGLWFAHENVNGVDFWNNEASYKAPPPRGRIVVTRINGITSGPHEGSFTAYAEWKDPDGVKFLNETRVTRILTQGDLRMVDLDITLTAANRAVFGDARTASLEIRLVPELQEDKVIKEKGKPDRTVPGAPGIIVSADGGQHEKAVWGKPSDWVDYSGQVGGEGAGYRNSRSSVEQPARAVARARVRVVRCESFRGRRFWRTQVQRRWCRARSRRVAGGGGARRRSGIASSIIRAMRHRRGSPICGKTSRSKKEDNNAQVRFDTAGFGDAVCGQARA